MGQRPMAQRVGGRGEKDAGHVLGRALVSGDRVRDFFFFFFSLLAVALFLFIVTH